MTVYVDDAYIQATVRNGSRDVKGPWCHLTATTVAELLEFATTELGMSRSWFQPDVKPSGQRSVRGGWHFDVVPSRRARAVRAGAVEVTTERMLEIMRQPGRETQWPEPADTRPVLRQRPVRTQPQEGDGVRLPIDEIKGDLP